MSECSEVVSMATRVMIDRRFCADRYHKALAEAVLSLTAENKALADEVARLAADKEALLTALKSMTSMYGHCWDLVDGGLLCMQSSVQRFEDAHEAAQKVIEAIAERDRP